jgi:hypothetical protein
MSEYIVTLTEDADPARVRDALARAGFAVREYLGEIGIITGEADEAAASAARSVPGVAAVESGHEVHIAPPDSSIQ